MGRHQQQKSTSGFFVFKLERHQLSFPFKTKKEGTNTINTNKNKNSNNTINNNNNNKSFSLTKRLSATVNNLSEFDDFLASTQHIHL